jgi:predicted transcriptional regulator
MTIDPKISMWLNAVLSIIGAVAGLGGFDIKNLTVAGVVTAILAAVNAVLHGVSAPVAGPIVKK